MVACTQLDLLSRQQKHNLNAQPIMEQSRYFQNCLMNFCSFRSSYLPFSKFVHPAWSRDMVNIGMAVFMAGAIMFCLLVGLNDTETPLTFRHLSPPPL